MRSRESGGRFRTALVVPIDVRHALVALVQRHYEGFDGGSTFRASLGEFFEGLHARSRRVRGGR